MPNEKTNRFTAQIGDFVVVKPGNGATPSATDDSKIDTKKKPDDKQESPN